MSANNIYYVYEWLRTDGSPYYIGKGKKKRAFDKRRSFYPGDDRVRLIKENLSEQEAWDLEVELIAKYGRKDLGTGILQNKTNGGEGSSGLKRSELSKQQVSEIMKEVSADPKWKENLSKKVRKTMNDPEFKKAHAERIKQGHAESDKMVDRGKHISETKQSKEWKESVWKEAHEKKMKTQRDPERVKARRERNTRLCPVCSQSIYGKNNMEQHLTNKHPEYTIDYTNLFKVNK